MTWQPIETAPRRVSVLIAGGTYRTDQDWADDWRPFNHVTVAFLREGDKEWIGDQLAHDEFFWHRPTHWMPLPEPPK